MYKHENPRNTVNNDSFIWFLTQICFFLIGLSKIIYQFWVLEQYQLAKFNLNVSTVPVYYNFGKGIFSLINNESMSRR